MPTVDPNHHATPDFPDPDLIDALAERWVTEGMTLGWLAGVVGQSVGIVEWTGDARDAAQAAAQAVQAAIQKVADNATALGNGLHDYANQVREAIKQEHANFIAEIVGLIFTVATFGFGSLLTAATVVLAGIFTEFGLSIEAATFVAGTIVFGGVAVGADLFGQLIGGAIAGTGLHIDPAMVPVDVAFGLIGGLGAAFFTKWLYFITARGDAASVSAAPVLDVLVISWLASHGGPALRAGYTDDYARYVETLKSWGAPHGLTPVDVEERIFGLIRNDGE